MMNENLRRGLRAGIITLCIAAMGSSSFHVHAEPSSAELEQKTAGLQGELNNLNNELNTLSSELDALSQKIEETQAVMDETQSQMDEAQKRGEEQYEAMKLRIKYMYEAGDTSFLELICSAESMSDFLNKTDFVKNVSEYDRKMLQELVDTQNEIRREGEALQDQQEELEQLKEQLNSKCTELENKIASTSGELNQYTDLLEKAKAAEQLAAKKAAEQLAAQKAAEQAANNNQGGNNNSTPAPVTPPTSSTEGKTSLGSFRITHYCPCYYCCGAWGGNTASGTVPTPGRTIAVDPSVIPLGSRVIINGNVYIAEDTGSAIKGKKIDIFVPDHSTALSYGVYYAEVYLAD